MNEPLTPTRAVPASYLLAADLLHMGSVALLLSMFLFVGTEVPLFFQMVITGLIMVVMLRGGGWLALGAMQTSLFFYESRSPLVTVQLSTIFTAVLCLALVAYAAGFRTIRRLLREWLGRMLHALLVAPRLTDQRSIVAQLDDRQQQLADWLWLREQSGDLLIRCGRLLAIVVVASIAFLQMPITVPGIRSWWNRTVAMDYMLWPGPNVFTIAIVCLLIWTIGSWRMLNRHQARLYLRSHFVRDHFRELRSILVRGRFLPEPSRPTNLGTVRKK